MVHAESRSVEEATLSSFPGRQELWTNRRRLSVRFGDTPLLRDDATLKDGPEREETSGHIELRV